MNPGILLRVYGVASINFCNDQETFLASEPVFLTYQTLAMKMDLVPGEFMFPFKLEFPKDVPPTFDSTDGTISVRYMCSAWWMANQGIAVRIAVLPTLQKLDSMMVRRI